MVDYENINCSDGLKGIEYLTEEDKIYIFYSKFCEKIKREYIDIIEKRGCELHVYKLKRSAKNALDFYIAAQLGECWGNNEKCQIAIISKDNGFQALVDFSTIKENRKGKKVVLGPTLEQAILKLENNSTRYNIIKKNGETVDINDAYKEISRKKQFRTSTLQIFSETSYEDVAQQVVEIIESMGARNLKQLYSGLLHSFGKKKGREIYYLVKQHYLEAFINVKY